MRNLKILLALLIPVFGNGQGINNLWMMGYGGSQAMPPLGGIEIDFLSGNPTITSVQREMEFGRAVSTISDSNGNLLFCTNGYYIADATGDTMLNGSGINPSIYTSWYPDGLPPHQLNMILPDPGNSDLYHLIHCTVDDPPGNLVTENIYHSIVDMTLNSGLGAVTSKNVILISDTLNPGKLTACRHGNGRDWWIVCHKTNSNIYFKFLLTNTGILGPFTQGIGVVRTGGDAGQVAFSQDGSKYAYYGLNEDVNILDFDRCSGLFSNSIHIMINDSSTGVGLSFSPNSKYLYISSLNYVYQFDVSVANVPSTQTTVAIWDGFYSPNAPFATLFDIAQLAPDGKIYIGTGNSTLHLHVINDPDSAGLLCNLVQHGLALPLFNYNSLPNHPNYFLGRLVGSVCDTLTSTEEYQSDHTYFNLYPNANDGNFNLSFTPQKIPGMFIIYDMLGNIVHRENIPSWTQFRNIELKAVAGMYFGRMVFNHNTFEMKFIIK